MFKKTKTCEKPATYKFFEDLPKREPIYLGTMTELHDDTFRWESAYGGNSGEGPPDVCMHMIQKCARESEAIIIVKTMGMRG